MPIARTDRVRRRLFRTRTKLESLTELPGLLRAGRVSIGPARRASDRPQRARLDDAGDLAVVIGVVTRDVVIDHAGFNGIPKSQSDGRRFLVDCGRFRLIVLDPESRASSPESRLPLAGSSAGIRVRGRSCHARRPTRTDCLRESERELKDMRAQRHPTGADMFPARRRRSRHEPTEWPGVAGRCLRRPEIEARREHDARDATHPCSP